jgi:hypothetical protein
LPSKGRLVWLRRVDYALWCRSQPLVRRLRCLADLFCLPGRLGARGRLLMFQRILARATDLGVSDLAEQHDHYLYGTAK